MNANMNIFIYLFDYLRSEPTIEVTIMSLGANVETAENTVR